MHEQIHICQKLNHKQRNVQYIILQSNITWSQLTPCQTPYEQKSNNRKPNVNINVNKEQINLLYLIMFYSCGLQTEVMCCFLVDNVKCIFQLLNRGCKTPIWTFGLTCIDLFLFPSVCIQYTMSRHFYSYSPKSYICLKELYHLYSTWHP